MSDTDSKQKRKKKKFAVLDSETDPFVFGEVPKPFIWGFYDGKIFKTFRETKKLVAFLSEQKITVYAHNGGKFDYMFLLDYINAFEKPTIINNRLSKLRIGKCTLVDSYNILPIALGDYKKDEIDYNKFKKKVREKHIVEITDYLRGDCVYLYDLVERYREECGADLTQASGAMKTYQKMKGYKVPRHKDKGIFSNFKNFYHGGRVQCFRTGIIDERFHVYDINSAYPFAMTYSHPYGLDFVYGDRELPFTENERVFYRLECVSRGAFPYRENPNSALSFPDDKETREFYVTDWEYWTAKNAKLISKINIIECVKFSDTRNFSDYVYRFYDGRKQAKIDGDKALDLLYKFRLNSLYGKFGSDYRKYENFIILPKDIEVDEWEKIDSFGKDNILLSKPLDDSEMNFYNVATAASVTGFVRAYWLAAAVRVGFKNLLYGDTDALAVLSSAAKNLNLGDELGAWKDEGEFIKAGIAGKKMYIFRKNPECKIFIEYKNKQLKKKEKIETHKKASKGVKLTDAELWKVARGGEVKHRKESPSFSITGKAKFTERTIKITT